MPRPKKKLTSKDYPQIAAMAARGLKKVDVARRLGMAVRTFDAVLERDDRAREAYQAGLSELHEELVGGLVDKARGGNVTAAIFLLKAKFEYRDNAPIAVEHEHRVTISLPAAMTPEQYVEIEVQKPAALGAGEVSQ